MIFLGDLLNFIHYYFIILNALELPIVPSWRLLGIFFVIKGPLKSLWAKMAKNVELNQIFCKKMIPNKSIV